MNNKPTLLDPTQAQLQAADKKDADANERKLVLLYNHADPDESFVTMLTDEELKQAKKESSEMSQELYDTARRYEVVMPSVCYYA